MSKPRKVEEPAIPYPAVKVTSPKAQAAERPAATHAASETVHQAAKKIFTERQALLHRLAQ
jgi:hypothetical protein